MTLIRGKYLNNSHWIPCAELTARSAHNNNIYNYISWYIIWAILRNYDVFGITTAIVRHTRGDVIFNAFYFRSLLTQYNV